MGFLTQEGKAALEGEDGKDTGMYALKKIVIQPGRLVYIPARVQAVANGKWNATNGIIRGDEERLEELGLQAGSPYKGICVPEGVSAMVLINFQEDEITVQKGQRIGIFQRDRQKESINLIQPQKSLTPEDQKKELTKVEKNQ